MTIFKSRLLLLAIYCFVIFVITAFMENLFFNLIEKQDIWISCVIVFSSLVIFNQAASDLVRQHLLHFLPSRKLPRMKLNYAPMNEVSVVIPTLLISRDHILQLIRCVNINFQNVNDVRVTFVILVDPLDSHEKELTAEERNLLQELVAAIAELNRIHSRTQFKPFILMTRERIYAPTEGVWMGWERKMGKLLEFFEIICTGKSSLRILSGHLVSDISHVKYAVVLDDDNIILPNSAHVLVATISDPMNIPCVNAITNKMISGYAIIMPLTQQRSVKLNPRNAFFDLFGCVKFIGKGVYNVRECYSAFKDKYPIGRVLSHDMWESLVVRTGFTADATVVEDMPSSHIVLRERAHRWIRGDWQNLLIIISQDGREWHFPAFGWLLALGDARRSLNSLNLAVSILILSLYFRVFDIIIFISLAFVSEGVRTTRALFGASKTSGIPLVIFFKPILIYFLVILFELINAPLYGLLNLDAVIRTVANFVRGKNMLVWRSFAQAEISGSSFSLISVYPYFVPLVCLFVLSTQIIRPTTLVIVGLWLISPFVSAVIRRRSPK